MKHKKHFSRKIIFFLIITISILTFNACSKNESISLKEYKARQYTLDNGLRVIINEDHRHPVVAIYALVDVGSSKEGKYEGSGVSHFIEHMLFKGTPQLKVGEFHSRVSALGGETNAHTSFDYTGFYITAPSSGLNESLKLLSDVIINSSFDESEFQNERNVILREMDMYEDDPSSQAIRNLFAESYIKHPYKYPVIGQRNTFKQLSRDDLYNFYKNSYTPDNIIISISGDVETEETLALLKKDFNTFKSPPLKTESQNICEPRQVGRLENVTYADVSLGYVALAYKSVSIYSPDLYALDVLAIALGEGKYSILAKDLKREKKLVYSINAYNYTPNCPGLFIFETTCDGAKYQDVIKAIDDKLTQIKKEGISRKDLKRAKKLALSNEINALNTYEAKAKDLAYSLIMSNDLNFSNTYIENIQKVTSQDIIRVAKQYFRENQLTVSAVLPETSKSQKKSSLNSDALENESNEINVKKIELENGLRLLIAQDSTYPLINIQIIFKGGLRYENQSNNGISFLLSSLITDTYYNTKSISNQLEDRGGSISSYSQNNSFGIAIQVLRPDEEFALEILDHLLNGVRKISKNDIEYYKNLQLAAIKAQEDDIFSKSFLSLRQNYFINHPYSLGHLGTQESLKNINEEELLKFYYTMLEPKNIVVAVTGDIDEEKIASRLKANLSKLKPPINSFSLDLPDENRIKESKIIKESTKDKQAIIMIAYPAPKATSKDRYAFDVLAATLSGGGSKLFYSLRDVQHLAYSVGAFSLMGFEPGCLVFYLSTTPQRAKEAQEALLNEISLIKTQGLRNDEIDQAKQELIGQYQIGLQTNQQLAFQCALDELYSNGYDHYLRYDEEINSVTQEDIKGVINQYLNTDEYLILVLSNDEKIDTGN
jgi:zinc protease